MFEGAISGVKKHHHICPFEENILKTPPQMSITPDYQIQKKLLILKGVLIFKLMNIIILLNFSLHYNEST